MSEISKPNLVIHDLDKNKLLEFMENNRVKHKFVDDFMLKVSQNKNLI
jgi:hypothetical protein